MSSLGARRENGDAVFEIRISADDLNAMPAGAMSILKHQLHMIDVHLRETFTTRPRRHPIDWPNLTWLANEPAAEKVCECRGKTMRSRCAHTTPDGRWACDECDQPIHRQPAKLTTWYCVGHRDISGQPHHHDLNMVPAGHDCRICGAAPTDGDRYGYSTDDIHGPRTIQHPDGVITARGADSAPSRAGARRGPDVEEAAST